MALEKKWAYSMIEAETSGAIFLLPVSPPPSGFYDLSHSSSLLSVGKRALSETSSPLTAMALYVRLERARRHGKAG